MNRFTKITAVILMAMTFISSCNDNNNPSAFDDILQQAPYKNLSDSIDRDKKNDELFFRRAVLLNKNNLPEPALADFNQAWLLKKDERYALGISTILADKKPDSAIVFLNSAIRLLSQSILLKLNLARIYDTQQKTEEALTVCNSILEMNPQQVDVLKLVASLMDKKGNTKEAINTLERAYGFTPYDLELNYMLAIRYAENKNSKILLLCDSLLSKDSLHLYADPYYYKGIYYANTGESAKAIDNFNEAIKHNYQFIEAYIEKGAVWYDQKKYTDAQKVFELALRVKPEYPDAYYWIGKCQEAQGQKEDALMNFKKAYGLDKNFSQARESIERLSK